jgi:hypothetical protein
MGARNQVGLGLYSAMGARNQVGLGLYYRPANLISLANQFQTRFLESISRPIAGLSAQIEKGDLNAAPIHIINFYFRN